MLAISGKEQYVEMPFPINGLDLLRGFAFQGPLTTPVGLNVRTFEPTTLRARGGQRPGLDKYISSAVPTGTRGVQGLIQHLNVVVDPSADALVDDTPNYTGGVDDPSSAGPVSSWPPGGASRNPGRTIRPGGWGFQPNKNRKRRRKTISFVQGAWLNALSCAYPGAVGKDNLLLACFGYFSFTGAVTLGASDTQASAWSLAVQVEDNDGFGNITGIAILYAVAGGAGSSTVTLTTTPTPAVKSLVVLEYKNTDASTPLDGTISATQPAPAPSTMDAGLCPVSVKGDLLIGAFMRGQAINTYSAGSGFFDRSTAVGNFNYNLCVEDLIGANADTEIKANTGDPPDGDWAAVGASFKGA